MGNLPPTPEELAAAAREALRKSPPLTGRAALCPARAPGIHQCPRASNQAHRRLGRAGAEPRDVDGPGPHPTTEKRPPGPGAVVSWFVCSDLSAPPTARVIARFEKINYAKRADRVVIRHGRRKVVAIIEIVSPGTRTAGTHCGRHRESGGHPEPGCTLARCRSVPTHATRPTRDSKGDLV